LAEQWEEGYRQLKKFCERVGNCKVPSKHIENDFQLGAWVQTQRRFKSALSNERFVKLEELGFQWDLASDSWENGYEHLKQFKEREGHCRAFKDHIEDGFSLGTWIKVQRRNKEKLPAERIKRLDKLGFVWDPIADQWDEGYRILKKFSAREGHCLVPQKHIEDGYPLGQWVTSRRRSKASIEDLKLRQLESIGFVWDPLQKQLDEGLRYLKAFKDREGHCLVPQLHIEDGFALGKWVNSRRARQTAMDPVFRKKLDELGFIWDARK
jgi:hypothetical protein